MATSVQSILGSPLVRSSNNARANVFALPRNARLNIKCMAEDGKKEETSPISSPELKSTIPTPAPKPIKPKVSTDFFDLFAFSGPAPERINGRLAMTGFVAAIAVELASGQDVFSQISNGGGTWFLYTSVLLSVASLVPLFNGVRAESKSGFMSPDAEMWNGRFAMLGLVALAFTEFVKGSALVSACTFERIFLF